MAKLGVLFDIGQLGEGFYGQRAMTILFEAIDGELLSGCRISYGDTRATLSGQANHFCVAIEPFDTASLRELRAALAVHEARELLPLPARFLEGPGLATQPLVGGVYLGTDGRPINDTAGLVRGAWEQANRGSRRQ